MPLFSLETLKLEAFAAIWSRISLITFSSWLDDDSVRLGE